MNISDNLDLVLLAHLFIELIEKTSYSVENAGEIFQLYNKVLSSLSNERKFQLVETFKIKLMQSCGILPDTTSCSICGAKWIEKSVSINNTGNFECKKCSLNKGHNENKLLPFNIVKLINYLAKTPLENIKKIRIIDSEKKQLRKITGTLLRNYISADINTEKMMTGFDD